MRATPPSGTLPASWMVLISKSSRCRRQPLPAPVIRSPTSLLKPSTWPRAAYENFLRPACPGAGLPTRRATDRSTMAPGGTEPADPAGPPPAAPPRSVHSTGANPRRAPGRILRVPAILQPPLFEQLLDFCRLYEKIAQRGSGVGRMPVRTAAHEQPGGSADTLIAKHVMALV